MRKTLALVLSIVMVLSLAVVGVSAADATEIKTAAEFAAMAADGNYKLGADITITESYGAGDTVTPFTGTFDGNGHSVTIAAPMFVQFCGTIKNLTINGSASKDGTANEVASYCGAIANNIPKEGGTAVFENIVNNANITGKYRIGGLIGQISSGNTVTFNNCVNNGTINGGNMVGGLVGYSQNNEITMTNCVNNGKVFVDVSRELTGLAAGIIGRFGADTSFQVSSASHITIVNCLNNGEVTGTSQAAGFLAHARNAIVTITNCTNKGNITSTYTASNDGTSDAGGFFGSTGGEKGYYCMVNISKCVNEGKIVSKNARAGGIAGYVWCGGQNGDYPHAEIIDCVNNGAVEAGSFASQFLAYTNDTRNNEGEKKPTKIQGIGLGSTARCAESKRGAEPDANGKNSAYMALVGVSSATNAQNYDWNLTIVETAKPDWVAYSEGTPANRLAISEAPDTIKFVSATEAQAAAAALGEIGYKAPVTPPATGDAMVWVVVVALVSVLGMGIAVKAKNN